MSHIPRFAEYAAAFEKAYASDDWAPVEPFFTEDAVYDVTLGPPFGGRFEGRTAILAYFKDILDRLDRRFERREVEVLEGPRQDGDAVWIRGRASYHAPGVPELSFELEETASFEGDRIRHLVDRYDPETEQAIEAWLGAHGAKLGIA